MTFDFYKRSPFIYIIASLVLFSLSMVVWRWYTIRRIPVESIRIPPIGIEERLDIPQRPGVRGILVSGPMIEPLFFSIDLSRSGVQPLDWRQLNRIDPHTDIKVSCRIDNQGRLHFGQNDILMAGHTEAGMMIQQALRTWVYTPYKSGRIRFWFNLPSKGIKLTIDTHALERREGIASHVPVYDGRLHMVEDVYSSDVRIGRFY